MTKKSNVLARLADALSNRHRWEFEWRYWRGRTPWDTQRTPPEVMAFLQSAAPGRALDLGCGTGTNVITLAQHGWQVTGVDFSPKAIRTARRKTAAAGIQADLSVQDVIDLGARTGPFDYILDIGCLHSLTAEGHRGYAAGVTRLLRPGGRYMLYAWLPRIRRGRQLGLSPQQVEALFAPAFSVDRVQIGTEQGAGSAWYWLTKNKGAPE